MPGGFYFFDIRCIFIQTQREHQRDGWPGERIFLRPFNAKQSICVYRFPVYTKDPLLHIWAWAAGRYAIKGSAVKITRNSQVLNTFGFCFTLLIVEFKIVFIYRFW